MTAGIVRPGYSYCTYGDLLSPSGLGAVPGSDTEASAFALSSRLQTGGGGR